MAPPVADGRRSFTGELVELLLPFPGRLENAVRLASVCALVLLAVQMYGAPEPALTCYVAFFMVKPDRMTSVVTSLVFVVIVTLLIGTLFVIAMQVADHPVARLLAMTVLSVGVLFLGVASKLKALANIIALILGYALDLLGTAHEGEVVTRALLYAWLFVGFPAVTCIVVNLGFGPSPRRKVEEALAYRLGLCAAMLRGPSRGTRRAFVRGVDAGLGEVAAWSKLASAEKTSSPADVAALVQATRATAAIEAAVELSDREGAVRIAAPVRERLAGTLEQMAGILRRGGYPVAIEPAELDGAANPALAELQAALRVFAEPAPIDAARVPAPVPEVEKTSGFFLADAFTNPAHVRYALKTTAAAMLCYVTYSLLDWPGIHTCLITCYVVSLGTTAETVQKLTLRITGALVGASAGIAAIVFVMPHVTTVGGLAVVVFAGALASAWVSVGSPRISYVGLQIAYAFFLSVVQGTAPAFDMSVARDRVIGILFGDIVMALVSTSLWPVSVASRVDGALAALLARLPALVTAGSRVARWTAAVEARAALGAIVQDLQLVRYEPRSVRPVSRWMSARAEMARLLGELQAPLLVAGGVDVDRSHLLARRLGRLATSLGATAAAPEAAEERQPALAAVPSDEAALFLEPSLSLLEALVAGSASVEEGSEASHALA